MLTNIQRHQLKEGVYEMLAATNWHFCFGLLNHTQHGSLHCGARIPNPNKTKNCTLPITNMYGYPQKHTFTHKHSSLSTHTYMVMDIGAGPTAAGKVLRCAYERAGRARFLHKPLSTCCATFVTKGGLGHALKLLDAPLLPFIRLIILQHISALHVSDLEEVAGCLLSVSFWRQYLQVDKKTCRGRYVGQPLNSWNIK